MSRDNFKLLNASFLGTSILMIPAVQAATDYSFVTPQKAIHAEANYRQVGKAKFHKGPESGTHLSYADSAESVFLSHYLNDTNSITGEIGYSYLKLGWKENPRFKQTHFNYANASLGWVTTADTWRWIFSAAASVDAHKFDFWDTGVFGGMAWGRHVFANKDLGGHIGLVGYSGVKNHYLLPIIGFDYKFADAWQLNAIFPIDLSLEYFFQPKWSTEVALATFGGPYRFPRRTHKGIGEFKNGIFEVYSTGLEWDINYNCNQRFNPEVCDQLINASLGLGWNFGGWILIKNSENEQGQYYKFKAAPYIQAELSFTF